MYVCSWCHKVNDDGLRTAHLFAGAGGGLLADLILGHNPVLAVEQEESCCKSMHSRVLEGWLPSGLHIHCGDVQQFDFAPWAGRVDCIAAGFPCQDISCAGSGKGLEGARSGLVWEVLRAVDAIRPGLVFLENSPRIRTKGRRDIIRALVERGYSWRDGTLAAAAVGAGHERDRWWLLAANADGLRKLEQERSEREQWGWFSDLNQEIADVARFGLQKTRASKQDARNWGEIAEAADVDSDVQQSTATTGYQEVGRTGNGYRTPADALRKRLQVAVQRGGLSETSAATVQAAAGYTGAYRWSPPDAGICGMVDGLADFMEFPVEICYHACVDFYKKTQEVIHERKQREKAGAEIIQADGMCRVRWERQIMSSSQEPEPIGQFEEQHCNSLLFLPLENTLSDQWEIRSTCYLCRLRRVVHARKKQEQHYLREPIMQERVGEGERGEKMEWPLRIEDLRVLREIVFSEAWSIWKVENLFANLWKQACLEKEKGKWVDGCTKGARINACGNGQVPLAAAAAWIILSEG